VAVPSLTPTRSLGSRDAPGFIALVTRGMRAKLTELAESPHRLGTHRPTRADLRRKRDVRRRWISDAQIAETVYTAFAGTRHAVTARLIVRRIRRDDPAQIPGQEELLPTYRYHAVFTDSPFTLVQAEAQHRQHAVIEQINADLIAGPLTHLPSGRFNANAAWLTCAAIARNLTRAAGHLAAGTWSTARTATIRTRIINVAARLAHRARTIHLHLPQHWPWQAAFENLFTAVHPAPG
jgi:hypothetical protein